MDVLYYYLPFLEQIRDFFELGGPVLRVIGLVTLFMWMLIIERLVYFRTGHRKLVRRAHNYWDDRSDYSSWRAHQIRTRIISEVSAAAERNLALIKTCVALCPLLGLLGTVLGMLYDFADDSGLRFMGGVTPACGSSAAAVLGLLIHSDSRFRCDCNPPIKTSVAFAPAERTYNEDWAIFFDRSVNTRVRHASLNLGAFGDRRDYSRKLWLALPRNFDRGYGYVNYGYGKGLSIGHNGFGIRFNF